MSTLDEAIRFAAEIIRKRDATDKTVSPRLKRDYNKSISSDMEDLLFYVKCHKLDMSEVWNKAFKFYNKQINTSKEGE